MAVSERKPTGQKLSYSYQTIFVASDLARRRLPMIRAQADAEGPTLWLTACAHGDEVGGVAVIHEVFRRLRAHPLRCGSVHAFPLMNPFAFELGTRHLPLGNEDLNRSFPGKANGSLAARIAHRVFETIRATAPALILDLHNDWTNSIPYVIVDPSPGPAGPRAREGHASSRQSEGFSAAARSVPGSEPIPDEAREGQSSSRVSEANAARESAVPGSEPIPVQAWRRARELATRLGLVVVAERADADDALGWERTLSGCSIAHGLPALTLELGEAQVINELNVQVGVAVVFNALKELGMVEDDGVRFGHATLASFGRRLLYYSDQPYASSSGILRFHVRPGEVVRKGRVLARTYNAFGKMLERLRAPQDGIVLGHSDTSIALPGIPILGFAIADETAQVDTAAEAGEPSPELLEEPVPASELPFDAGS